MHSADPSFVPNGQTMTAVAMSVIIAARNEAAGIETCLNALLAQEAVADGAVQVIVVANGCTDQTVAKASALTPAFAARGWVLTVMNLTEGGKLGALNAGEAAAAGKFLAYLDADVLGAPTLLAEVAKALAPPGARYATGRISVIRAKTAATRAYARIWTRLPFVTAGAVGAGFFAINREGRARWADWPDIISDDTFARLQFAPEERVEVAARYHWPMVEGFSTLVRVRRRQDAGVAQIAAQFPMLLKNDTKERVTPALVLRLALTDPLGLAVYLAVHLAVRRGRDDGTWTRGR